MRETCTDTNFHVIAVRVIELRVFKKKKNMDKIISPVMHMSSFLWIKCCVYSLFLTCSLL